MNSTDLVGHTILVMEDEAIIALDLETALAQAGAKVTRATSTNAMEIAAQAPLSAAVLDLQPASGGNRALARLLKQKGVPFLFYSTHGPEDVTTMRGAPVIFKPARSEEIVSALVLLIAGT